jgi:hypothetical protein
MFAEQIDFKCRHKNLFYYSTTKIWRTGQNKLCTEDYFIVQQNKEQTLSHNAVNTCIIVHRNQIHV